ncbi:MAG: hypothetical protein BalsKO_26670 [Balneolaceae bacterium]
MNISNFIEELKRRNVVKVATAYAIAGWLIIQVIDTISPQLGFPGWIPPFITILVLVGFPLALIFAWAFELTPEGIKKSVEVDITESVTQNTGKKLNGIIISVLSVAVFFLLTERIFFADASFLSSDSSNIENASIAVLPFVNMSGDEENEYFSDGLSEELLNGLAKLGDIQVAGRTSSFQFKGQNLDLREVGIQLGVQHILEGSVRKSGDRIRITAQLIQADNGFHLWSETYDRELTASDVFDIQEEITRRVVAELKIRLLPEEEVQLTERPTTDIEAYNAFLEATQLEINRLPSDLEKAIEKYKQAIEIDPTFALAYARLAIAYDLSYRYGYERSDEKREELQAVMRVNIDQALLLDSNLGKAYEALGEYYLNTDLETDEMLEKYLSAYAKAVDLSPNDAFAHYGYFVGLRWKDFREYERIQTSSFLVLEEAYELDPLNPVVARAYANYLVDIKQEFDQGLAVMDQIIKNYPNFMPIKVDKSWVMRDMPYGRPDEAFKYMYEAHLDDPKNFRYMNALVSTALDVDFLPFAEYISNRIEESSTVQNRFFRMYSSTINILRYRKEYEQAEQLITERIDSILVRNEETQRENFIGSYPPIYFLQGKYDEIIEIAKIRAPEIFEPTFQVADSNEFYVELYTSILIKKGEREKANAYADLFCESLPDDIKDLDDYDDISEFYTDKYKCNIFSGNYESAVEGIRNIHFELNSKANWPLIFSEPAYSLLDDYPPYIDLKKDMFDDLHRMRANIIGFLKEQDEWKVEWGEEN